MCSQDVLSLGLSFVHDGRNFDYSWWTMRRSFFPSYRRNIGIAGTTWTTAWAAVTPDLPGSTPSAWWAAGTTASTAASATTGARRAAKKWQNVLFLKIIYFNTLKASNKICK